MIFVDTGAWFASVVPTDPDHQSATHWLNLNTQPLLTTDYVIDETLTLLRARGETTRALRLGEQFFAGNLANLYFVSEDDVRETWEVFRRYSDKRWSFTDCSSRVVIQKLGITHAFSFDKDFVQFGWLSLLRNRPPARYFEPATFFTSSRIVSSGGRSCGSLPTCK